MKKTVFNFLLIVIFAPFLVQCASQTDVDELRYQLRIVNKKLEDMKSTTFGQLQKRQAASSGQLDQFELQMLELKSQLEETNHTNRKLREQNKELEQSIDTLASSEATKREELLEFFNQNQLTKEKELNALNEKLRIQHENVQAIQDARIRDAELRAQKAAKAAEAAKVRARTARATTIPQTGNKHILAEKKKVKFKVAETITAPQNVPQRKLSSDAAATTTPPATPPTTVVAKTSSSKNEMTEAQQLFDNGKFNKAFDSFEQIAINSSSKESVNARFMMGECLFKQKEYDKAIMQYQKIISQNSGHEKASVAMLRQGIAFEKLSDKETAKVIYKKILKQHGSSASAAEAQKRLDKL